MEAGKKFNFYYLGKLTVKEPQIIMISFFFIRPYQMYYIFYYNV